MPPARARLFTTMSRRRPVTGFIMIAALNRMSSMMYTTSRSLGSSLSVAKLPPNQTAQTSTSRLISAVRVSKSDQILPRVVDVANAGASTNAARKVAESHRYLPTGRRPPTRLGSVLDVGAGGAAVTSYSSRWHGQPTLSRSSTKRRGRCQHAGSTTGCEAPTHRDPERPERRQPGW